MIYTSTIFFKTVQGRSVTSINYIPAVIEFLVKEVIVKIRFQQYDDIKVGRASGQVKLICLLSYLVHILEINWKIRQRRSRNGSWAVPCNITRNLFSFRCVQNIRLSIAHSLYGRAVTQVMKEMNVESKAQHGRTVENASRSWWNISGRLVSHGI
jgi:hypothetical protein